MNNGLLIGSIFGIIFLSYSFTRKLGNFLNIYGIILSHLSFFKHNKMQFFSIYFIPIIFSLSISSIHIITRDIFDTLVIILSILISMFFAILSILCTIKPKNNESKYNELLEQSFTSTVFEIILCIILLLISFSAIFVGRGINPLIDTIVSTIVYYLFFILVLNIFVLIKRIEVLFINR